MEGPETPAPAVASTAKVSTMEDDRLQGPSPTVRENDVVLLHFADGRQIFAQCMRRNRKGPLIATLKINKFHYPTHDLIGLPYGTVLEVGKKVLTVLPPTEDIIPTFSALDDNDNDYNDSALLNEAPPNDQVRDNRNIHDDNTSQALDQKKLLEMRETGTEGSAIVQEIVANSATFSLKTDFARAKYIQKKQLKYQPRCRLTRCTAATISEALYNKDAKRYMNLRQDTLGQILSYANITAGAQVLVWDSLWGLITGAIAERMGGYGRIFSVYVNDSISNNEMVGRFNLSFREQSTIKWVHAGDVYKPEPKNGDKMDNDDDEEKEEDDDDDEEEDLEAKDRDLLKWPCPLQDHTRRFLGTFKSKKEQRDFLAKRSARFVRKLTRHSPDEAKAMLHSRKCDSLVIVVKNYDLTETLLALLHHLSPSCPFVVYSEFIEPLTVVFRAVQAHAINLRLSDTWAREYQVLPGRTHPVMDMRQSGGFLLTGIKLDETYGHNELDEELLNEIKEEVGGRRRRHQKKRRKDVNPKRTGDITGTSTESRSKRPRTSDV